MEKKEPSYIYIEYLSNDKTMQGYMTDQEVIKHLSIYDDYTFNELPAWLKQELYARNLLIPVREPSPTEMEETKIDHFHHRVINKELTLDDYHKHFTGKRKIP